LRTLKELHNLASFCQKWLVQLMIVWHDFTIMILLRTREFAPRPPSMPVRGCKPLRRVGKIVVTLSPAAAWTYFDIAGNAPARRGGDFVLLLSFVREP
jgi:hypothetical protein